MELPATIGLYVGVDAALTPYGELAFSPDPDCVTTRTTSVDPTSDDFGTRETTTCTTAAGWGGAAADPGSVFPALVVGGALERDRLRLGALFSLGPAFAAAAESEDRTLTPDLALGGQFSLEAIAVRGRLSFAAGALGSLRAFSAHGTHAESGDTRLSASAVLGGGPTVSVGLPEPGLLFRLYGVYTTEAALGGGLTVTWAPIRGAVEPPSQE